MRYYSYADVFMVSEAEVDEHGIPHSESTGKDSLKADFHYYQEEVKWHTFFRERNILQAG